MIHTMGGSKMGKLILCMFFIMILSGCGTGEEKGTSISPMISQAEEKVLGTSPKVSKTEEKGDEDISMEEPTAGAFINCYKVVEDEEIGEQKEGFILDDLLKYDGGRMKLKVSLGMFLDDSYEEIPVLLMVFLDDHLIPFSLAGKEEALLHELSLENNKDCHTYIEFVPVGASDIEEKSLSVIAVPFYDKPETSISENDILKYTVGIISENGSLEEESGGLSDDYFIADMTTVYQKELHEISKYNKIVADYLLFDAEGSFCYSGDYLAGEYVTFLFCDGKLYPGFNGESYFLWEKEDDNFVHHKIDLEDLEKGKHIFFTITFERNTDKCRAKKSMNCEVQIDE